MDCEPETVTERVWAVTVSVNLSVWDWLTESDQRQSSLVSFADIKDIDLDIESSESHADVYQTPSTL